jgi:hypothetical protein
LNCQEAFARQSAKSIHGIAERITFGAVNGGQHFFFGDPPQFSRYVFWYRWQTRKGIGLYRSCQAALVSRANEHKSPVDWDGNSMLEARRVGRPLCGSSIDDEPAVLKSIGSNSRAMGAAHGGGERLDRQLWQLEPAT